jgi:hypothetical protein
MVWMLFLRSRISHSNCWPIDFVVAGFREGPRRLSDRRPTALSMLFKFFSNPTSPPERAPAGFVPSLPTEPAKNPLDAQSETRSNEFDSLDPFLPELERQTAETTADLERRVNEFDSLGLFLPELERQAAETTADLERRVNEFDAQNEAGAAPYELNELDLALPVVPVIAAELPAARAATKRKRLLLLVSVAAALASAVAGTLVGRTTHVNRELSSVAPVEVAPLVARAIPMFSGGVPDVPSTLTAELFEAPPVVPTAQDAFAPRVDPVPDPLPPRAPAIRPRAPVEAPARVAERVSAAPVPAERVSAAPVPAERVSAAPVPAERAVEPPLPATSHFDPPPASAPALAVDDSALIRDALQRYRRAYNALDARLAHAVYPGVDETALTRAFEGLQSQSLDFEACTVDAIGMSAHAVCRGSARYVPRIGSRAPRAEPRVWTFRLRKDGGDWTIESAWTNR